ncbi:acyl-CoA N-acyltransferase [Xylaria bambusicola]|uniref:acyl-CoA N-acyltransferase n=1 Tax=Xylaria bambusicola TaxID=326684 RepID=UPI002008AEBB|nr:acyl-CoA N-acyltransferase [Xylaria bambusicola]KAI0528087.1 acyl-CoA N-acyltransferase [Xylaria bambusicola]
MATWRSMTNDDIHGVMRVADIVHAELAERDSVPTERVRLFPEGCLVLKEGSQVCGYAISHPIRYRKPPALDSLVGEIASEADQFYIHDICVLPNLRGHGYAGEVVDRLLAVAERYTTTCLVSVYGSSPFWARFGFKSPDDIDQALSEKIRGYGDDAIYLERRNRD